MTLVFGGFRTWREEVQRGATGGLTRVPPHEGRDGTLLPGSPVVDQLSSQGQRWRDGLQVMSHQNACRNTANVLNSPQPIGRRRLTLKKKPCGLVLIAVLLQEEGQW